SIRCRASRWRRWSSRSHTRQPTPSRACAPRWRTGDAVARGGYNPASRKSPPFPDIVMDSKTVETRTHHQPRLEDDPLVRGLGRYAADAPLTGQAYAYFVRSPHAFADIRSIDIAAAKAVPGVLAVLTAADMDDAKIGKVSQHPPLAGRGGTKLVV